MTTWLANWPTWQLIRSLGLVSYLLIALGICVGILYGLPGQSPKLKKRLYKLHPILTNLGAAIALLHGSITVIDAYMPFEWKEVLVPFTAAHAPVTTGMGTLAGYGLLLIILTTDIRNKLSRKLWRWLHFLAYPVFIMATFHGILLGTDSSHPLGEWTYATAIGAVTLLTALRLLLHGYSGSAGKRVVRAGGKHGG